MIEISFFVPGTPVAKGRPKFARRGKFTTAYTPEKTATYETLVGWHAGGVMSGSKPHDGAVEVHMVANMPIPASTTKKIREAIVLGSYPHLKRPDMDNIGKAATDGMNGIVYLDDSQIVYMTARKVYSDCPGLSVRVVFK